jgi:hypothetical protein
VVKTEAASSTAVAEAAVWAVPLIVIVPGIVTPDPRVLLSSTVVAFVIDVEEPVHVPLVETILPGVPVARS